MVPRLPALLLALLLAGCTSTTSADPGASATPSPTPTAAAQGPGIPTSSPLPAPSTSPLPYALEALGEFPVPAWVGAVPGDPNSLYLVERTGKIVHLDAQGALLGTVLDLTAETSHGNEQGVLSIAFDPAYALNHRMYVDFTDKGGDTKVVAYTVTDGTAGNGQQLLTVDHPFPNHNGGMLLFDRTGMLLVGLGDGGSAGDPGNRAQDLNTDLGKILRLDPRTGEGAKDNPFRNSPKIWALGLRNPLRFSFDTNGDFYLGDVGENKVEELDVVPPQFQKGANYGWSVFQGNDRFHPDEQITVPGPLIVPALTYPHTEGGCSISGGEVYHGRAIPSLDGAYVFGDYCEGALLMVRRTASGVTESQQLGLRVEGLAGFGHDAHGELLVLAANGLYRLVATT